MVDLDLPTSMTVTRTEMPLPPLEINTNDTYTLVRGGLDMGSRTWKRQTVTSPFTDGRTVVGRTLDIITREITIRVKGSSGVDLNTKMEALVRAFSQFVYTITVDIDGHVHAWRCETADVTMGDGGKLQDLMAMSYRQEVTFSVPCNPHPINNPSLGAI